MARYELANAERGGFFFWFFYYSTGEDLEAKLSPHGLLNRDHDSALNLFQGTQSCLIARGPVVTREDHFRSGERLLAIVGD